MTIASCSRSSDAAPEGTGTATLSWQVPGSAADGSRLDGLAGYTIYYGTDPQALLHVVRVTDPDRTGYVIRGLAPGTYYFSIAAFTASGLQSGLSPPVTKIIPP